MEEMKMSDDTLIKSPTKKKKRKTKGVQNGFNQKVMNSDDEEEEKKGFTLNSTKKSKFGKLK